MTDSRIAHPHDRFMKELLAHPEQAGALLRERLPEAVVEFLSAKPPELVDASFVDVRSLQIIYTFFKQIGLFLVPVFHCLNGGNVTQYFLWDVVIIDLNITFDGIGQLEGGIEAGGGQDLGDTAVGWW